MIGPRALAYFPPCWFPLRRNLGGVYVGGVGGRGGRGGGVGRGRRKVSTCKGETQR